MIVVCGEALMDVFAEHEDEHRLALGAHDGGSPFNLAIGLARLGAPTMFFGGLSNDLFGRRLERRLRREGVLTDAAPRSDAPTTLALVELDDAGVPSYRFYGGQTVECAIGEPALAKVPLDSALLHVGSYCTVVEPVAATLRTLVERQRGRSLVSYDPNVRLSIEPSTEKWRAALDWMLPRADIVKVSDEDLASLYPGREPGEFMVEALRAGVALVVVTRGAHGVVARSAAGFACELAAPAVDVVDTVGAGDSFQAALLAWLASRQLRNRADLLALEEAGLHAALQFASHAAAMTCARRGPDLPRASDLPAFA